MIDFHCHLDLYPDPHQVARDCAEQDLYVLSVTTTPSAWNGTAALAAGATRIRTALGLHPQLAHQRLSELPLFDQLLPETRYVGEIGLDGTPQCKPHWASQITVFDHILTACSVAGGRILSIHSRRAATSVLDRLSVTPGAGTAILHWFSGTSRELARAVELGCWFSVGPAMLNSEKGRSLIASMPRHRLLTETDGPFAQIDGRPACPWDARLAVELLAGLWCESVPAVQDRLLQNFRELVSDGVV